jgi:hypothetical protein
VTRPLVSAPRSHTAAADAGRPAPRIVAGLIPGVPSGLSPTLSQRSLRPSHNSTPERPNTYRHPWPAAALLSVPASTVLRVESDDIVDPSDAAIQALLVAIAQNTEDDDKRDRLIDYIPTIRR